MKIDKKSALNFCPCVGCFIFIISLFLNSCNKPNIENNTTNALSSQSIRFEKLTQQYSKKDSKNFELINNIKSGIDFKFDLGDFYSRAKEYIFATPMGGVATGDFNGDSLPDIYFTSPSGGNRLYKNLGDFKFADVTKSAMIEDNTIWGTGAGFVDIDGDGHLDIYACGYMTPNKIFMNNGDETFTEKSSSIGLNHLGASMNLNFADIDGDGDLDAYLATTTKLPPPGTKFGVNFVKQKDGSEKPIIPKEIAEYWQFIYLPDKKVHKTEAGQADKIFLNKNGVFEDATTQSGIKGNYFTLSATWWDYDSDGDPDIYVSNDFTGPDMLYKNNGNGVFKDTIFSSIPHTPWFSMGSDSADVNNDGLIDLFATDMAATSHYREKVMMGNMNDMGWFLEHANPRQYMRNALYINTGTDKMLESAFLSGIASTDWSWSPRLEDFDCDGLIDLFVTNGVIRDSMNSDLSIMADKQFKGGSPEWRKFWTNQKMRKERNLAYKNTGNLKFVPTGNLWGLDHEGVSLGAATADFDGDGDLDIVVNNADGQPLLYKNNTTNNRISIKLIGSKKNTQAIGASVKVISNGDIQFKEINPVKGWLSSNDTTLSFGLGDNLTVDELIVRWRNGNVQRFNSITSNQKITIQEPSEYKAQNNKTLSKPPLFSLTKNISDIEHNESIFDDFELQPLLPNKQSIKGPSICWGDVDNDNDNDLFIGGAANLPSKLYINNNGTLILSENSGLNINNKAEIVACLFFDADSDNDLDIVIGAGSNEFSADDKAYIDQLYLNNGNGTFTLSPNFKAPSRPTNALSAIDINNDEKIDIIVGGSSVAGSYPLSEKTYVMLNKGNGAFEPIYNKSLDTTKLANEIKVNDIDNDGADEIIIACEWGPIRIYKIVNNALQEMTADLRLDTKTGWWNSINLHDFDNDGDLDILATNFGNNTKYKASTSKPELLYFSDFDESGKLDIVEAKYEGSELVPRRGFSCSQLAMPFIKDKMKTFHNFASSSLAGIYSKPSISAANKYEINTLESGVFINEKTHFKFIKLPPEAQIAPSFGSTVTDINEDGIADIVLAQNFYGPQRETGRMDGGLSLILLGVGDCRFKSIPHKESGIHILGDTREVHSIDLNNDGRDELIFALNNGPLMIYSKNK